MTKSSKIEKKSPITFQLKGIELLEACLNHSDHAMADLKVFHFDMKIDHKMNAADKLFKAIISIEIFNEQRDIRLGAITSNCIFEITNITDFIDPRSKQINFPDEFINTINSITISTARGIMFDQFRGTFLHNAFLPIVDPKSFVLQKRAEGLDTSE